jgi:hypothetical protein
LSWLPLAAAVATLGACASEPLGPEPSALDECSELGKLQQPWQSPCFRKELDPEADPTQADFGQVGCRAVSFVPVGGLYCDCNTPGLGPLDPERDEGLISVVRDTLTQNHECQAPCCAGLCLCELTQLSGADLGYCQGLEAEARPFGAEPIGWCYVDPDDGFGNPTLVRDCPMNARRRFRAVPDRTWSVVLVCQDDIAY